MKKSTKHAIVAVCVIVTFIVPVVQLAIGFHYIVKDGQDPNMKCQVAPDLPVLLAIGGIFSLIFLGTAYGFLKMISSIGKIQSNVAGKGPKILTGLISFIFGALTLIFFILIQIRVYGAYTNDWQSTTELATTYCISTIMQGALAVIVLTYINIILLMIVMVVILGDLLMKIHEEIQTEMEMVERNRIDRL